MTIRLNGSIATTAEKTGIASDLSLGANRFRPRRNMVVAMVGDSNTNGRPGWQASVDAEWTSPGGIFENATVYNNGANGSTLAGWVGNIVTKVGDARDPANNETTNPWDVVEGDPDIIIISLGTNDMNHPAARAGAGSETTFRANMNTLVNFFLENTTAIIWLRLPQPFHWGEGSDPFDYLTQWTDDDDCAASSATLRLIHTEWIGKHPRVMVYDSHKHLFGYRCDDKSVDCLDPELGVPLIDDGLHPETIGYRRVCQQMAEQWNGESYPFDIHYYPKDMKKNAKWARSFMAHSVTPTLISLFLEPELALSRGTSPDQGLIDTASSSCSRKNTQEIKALQDAILPTIYQELLNTGGNMNLYFHDTGNNYTFSKATFSQYVTNAGNLPDYVTLILTGIVGNPDAESGRCTFWVKDTNSMPFAGLRQHQDIIVNTVSGSASGLTFQTIDPALALSAPINIINQARGGSGVTTYEVRARNQIDGRYVTSETFNSGKPIAELEYPYGVYPSRIIMRMDLWPAGIICDRSVYFSVNVKNGTNNGNTTTTISRRGAGVFPTVTLQPVDTAVADGADAVFTAGQTGGTGSYVWQESTDSGVTWTDIPSSNSLTYTKVGCTLADSGKQYRCLIRYVEPGFSSDVSRFISTNTVTLTVS